MRVFPEHRQEILEELVKFRDEIKPDIVFVPSLNDIQIPETNTILAYKPGIRYDSQTPNVLKGSIKINGNEVVIIYNKGSQSCNGIKGVYHYEIKKGKLFFKLVNDNCDSRTEKMTTPWFKL